MSPTLHDFPYDHPRRKCYHKWIINVAPPGREHCIHQCLYCYARDAVYSRNRESGPLYYTGLAERVEKELGSLRLCPPVSLSNATDPCQDVPPLRAEVRRLTGMLLGRGVSLSIITKGDPSFLLDLPGFTANPRVFVAVSVEGPGEVLEILSPQAPSFKRRIEAVSAVSAAGVSTVARIDPVLPHLYRAVYGGGWMGELEGLVSELAGAGAKHVVASTGTLNAAARLRVHRVIEARSPAAAGDFLHDYRYDREYSGRGYRWVRDARLEFHRMLRAACAERGMTYAACIELDSGEADTPGLDHCEAFPAPFCRRDEDGIFHPVEGCTANCRVGCAREPRPALRRHPRWPV